MLLICFNNLDLAFNKLSFIINFVQPRECIGLSKDGKPKPIWIWYQKREEKWLISKNSDFPPFSDMFSGGPSDPQNP